MWLLVDDRRSQFRACVALWFVLLSVPTLNLAAAPPDATGIEASVLFGSRAGRPGAGSISGFNDAELRQPDGPFDLSPAQWLSPDAPQTELRVGSRAAQPDDSPTSNWLPTGPLDTVSFFGGLDGSKQPQDLGINANMGGRFAINWGMPLVEKWGLGLQAGMAYSFADAAVQVLPRLEGTDARNQYFTTVGVFERTDFGLNVSAGYDFLWEDYYDRFQFGQWRARIGYELTQTDELGVWFTKSDRGDSGSVLGVPLHLRPITMGNAFLRHTWSTGGYTSLWLGVAQEHGKVVLVLPDVPPVKHAFVYGADLHLPLNNWLALFGEANFITPASSGTVDAYLGITIYPGGGAKQAQRKRFMPLMPVAANTSFAVDLSR
ncbi:MAG: hypothetical protein EXS05_05435 [Planctomycetaceae bacterium]|nr:hypothetical protein [Planctomycetaceae bacterium]